MNKRKTPLDHEHIEPHMCDLALRLYILGQLPFFKDLTQAVIQSINLLFTERGYSPGEMIYLEESPAERFYVIADGNVKLMRHTPSGKNVMLDVLTPGAFFGSLSHLPGDSYTETAQAYTQACTLSIEGQDFRQILNDHPQVAVKVMDIMVQRLQDAQEMVRLLSVSSVESRLAFVLLKLADKLGDESDNGLLIQLPLGRTDLAELAGTTTETVSRIMSHFQKEKLIRSGRRWVAITDQAGLTKLTIT